MAVSDMLDRLLAERAAPKKKTPKGRSSPARHRAAGARTEEEDSPLAPARRSKLRLVVNVDGELLERLRRCAYWLPGVTIAGVAEAGIVRELERLERQHGEALRPIPAGQAVKRGRPVRAR